MFIGKKTPLILDFEIVKAPQKKVGKAFSTSLLIAANMY